MDLEEDVHLQNEIRKMNMEMEGKVTIVTQTFFSHPINFYYSLLHCTTQMSTLC